MSSTVPTRILSGLVRWQKAPRKMDVKRQLLLPAQCSSFWCRAHRAPSSFQYDWSETVSEVISSTRLQTAMLGLQEHGLGQHLAGDDRSSDGSLR